MNFELGKRYIVEVTDKGIIPINEFSTERFFDKDNDDLEFLTDEEKTEVINKVLAGVKAEIREEIEDVGNGAYSDGLYKALEILNNVGEGE